ncbi:MAG: response regulator [Candidatus Eremiobacteraeota bacterium]|nr:response regulator [Candidatus Eremiobacteraeota bacterium]
MDNTRVLVCDDEPHIVTLIMGWLETEGWEGIPCHSGEEAIKLALEEKPNLFIVDIMMPQISGYEVCRILKSDPRTCDIPLIFLSVRSDVSDIIEGLNLGASDYITKPFRPQELLARARASMREYARLKKEQDAHIMKNIILDRIPQAILLLDDLGRIIYCNNAAQLLSSRPVKEILGKRISEIVTFRNLAPDETMVPEGKLETRKIINIEGDEVEVNYRAFPITLPANKAGYLITL